MSEETKASPEFGIEEISDDQLEDVAGGACCEGNCESCERCGAVAAE